MRKEQNLVIVEIVVAVVAVVVDQIRETGGQGQNIGQVNILVFILAPVDTGTGKNRVKNKVILVKVGQVVLVVHVEVKLVM